MVRPAYGRTESCDSTVHRIARPVDPSGKAARAGHPLDAASDAPVQDPPNGVAWGGAAPRGRSPAQDEGRFEVIVGGSQFSASIAHGGSTSAMPAMTRPASSVAAATGGAAAPADARRRALLSGAQPANDVERRWVAQVEQALSSYLKIMQAVASEATRQASLGRDLHGNLLQRSEDHQFEQQVLDLVNRERARAGLSPLSYDRRLDVASERHNMQQAATRRMAHDGIGDGTPGQRIRAAGYGGSWGENVATGQLSPAQVVAEWMASPGHRRNILDPSFRLMGVSYGTAADGRTYWAQSFGG